MKSEDPVLQESKDEQLANFEVGSYKTSNAFQSYINVLTEIEQLNEPWQFDERYTQYFKDDSYDTIPSYLHQEL